MLEVATGVAVAVVSDADVAVFSSFWSPQETMKNSNMPSKVAGKNEYNFIVIDLSMSNGVERVFKGKVYKYNV
jgi:hypothetical protein